jgi:cytochrome c-type biogenesis protein CcmH
MAVLVLAAAAVATRPWWTGALAAVLRRRSANIAVYRTRIAELADEREAGLVGAEDAAAIESELGARLVDDVAGEETAPVHASAARRRWLPALLTAALLAAFAGGWYGLSGSWQLQRQIDSSTEQDRKVQAMVGTLADKLRQNPEDANGWALLGRSYAVMQKFAESAKAYGEANARAAAPNPEWLTGEGEALALARDRDLQGTPAQLFERALAIAPDYGKALWYAGLAAAQAGDAGAARERWTRLLATADLPPEMHDIVQKRLDDLGQQAPAAPAAANAATGGLRLHVSVAPALSAKVPAGSVVYVFAKAVQGPPMPLAVLRVPAAQLPADVLLDDTMAMAPQLRLSQFDRYTVTARISRSGGAQAQSGDLEGSLAAVRDAGTAALNLSIDHVVP